MKGNISVYTKIAYIGIAETSSTRFPGLLG